MLSRPVLYGLLAVAFVSATGGGAYLAVRQNDAALRSAVASAVVEQATIDAVAITEVAPVVDETEAFIEDTTEEPASRAEEVALPEPAEPPVARSASQPKPPPAAPPPSAPAVATAARAEPELLIVPEPAIEPNAPNAPVEPSLEPAPERAEEPAWTDEPDWADLGEPWPEAEPEPIAAGATDPFDPPPFEPAREPGPFFDPDEAIPFLEELVVSADSVIGLQIETRVSSEDARVEDPVDARVTRDVLVGSEVAIPAGSRVLGSVVLVERGGKMSKEARIGVRFHTLVLADYTELPIVTETIYREGEGQGKQSASKIGGAAVSGAILGAIFGGRKGAIIGGAAGAGTGTAGVLTGDRNRTTFLPGMTLTVLLLEPVSVLVEQ